MNKFKTRIEKLEELQPKGLEHLSDEELNDRFLEICAKPEFQAFLADDSNFHPLRLQTLKIMNRLNTK